MAKKSSIKKEFKKVRDIANSDSELSKVLKQIAEVENAAKGVRGSSTSERFRTPYVDAVPMSNVSWTK